MSQLFHRHPAVEGVALDQQEVLFHPATSKFVLLNPAACVVWQQLAGPQTAAQLADAVRARFVGAEAAAATADAAQLIEQLLARQFATAAAANPATTPTLSPANGVDTATTAPYHAPQLRDITEDEVLASFQMTAAEISAASCWWVSCATGCP